MYEIQKNEGITLIALVITIIVLLILAGVTLNLTLGENGLLKRAEGAKGEYTKSEIKEELEMDISELYIEKKQKGESLTKQDIANKLSDKVILTDVLDNKIEGEYKDYIFTIDENNKVIIGTEVIGIKPTAKITILTQEEADEVQLQVVASIEEGEIESIESMNGAELITENSNSDKIYEVIKNGEYRFKIKGTNGMASIAIIKVTNVIELDEPILQFISNVKDAGVKPIRVNGKNSAGEREKVEYSLNIIIHEGDLHLDGIKTVEGASLVDKEYSFGNAQDVATESEKAKNTVVLKVNGNLVIDEGVTLTAVKSEEGYGGPKGMIVYCTGELTNNGTISMTARGANAEGQDVYLYKNANGSYEYISKNGANGGAALSIGTKNATRAGNKGTDGVLRQTGGGRNRRSIKWRWWRF